MQQGREMRMMDLEQFWAAILSEEPSQVKAAYNTLLSEDQNAILSHLERMAHEEGWNDGQRRRSRAALQILQHPD